MNHLLAHRTQQEAGEPSAAATSDHDHVRVQGFLEQNGGRDVGIVPIYSRPRRDHTQATESLLKPGRFAQLHPFICSRPSSCSHLALLISGSDTCMSRTIRNQAHWRRQEIANSKGRFCVTVDRQTANHGH